MVLPLSAVAFDGYRSLRRIRFPVGHLTVLVGRNGVGKTNIYRALELLAAAAHGAITSALRQLAAEVRFDEDSRDRRPEWRKTQWSRSHA